MQPCRVLHDTLLRVARECTELVFLGLVSGQRPAITECTKQRLTSRCSQDADADDDTCTLATALGVQYFPTMQFYKHGITNCPTTLSAAAGLLCVATPAPP